MRDSFVAYTDKEEVRFVLLFDSATEFELRDSRRILAIRNSHRELVVRCRDEFESQHWLDQFERIKKENRAGLFARAIPNASFVPPRKNQQGRWFVCGSEYMRAVSEAISKAKEEIFITDWWFDPEIELIRDESTRNKLRELLLRKVEDGVKIFILVYGNLESVLPLGNAENIRTLKRIVIDKHGRNTGMYTMYHPDIRAGAEEGAQQMQWAHHEKIVVIDQSTAFVGGVSDDY